MSIWQNKLISCLGKFQQLMPPPQPQFAPMKIFNFVRAYCTIELLKICLNHKAMWWGEGVSDCGVDHFLFLKPNKVFLNEWMKGVDHALSSISTLPVTSSVLPPVCTVHVVSLTPQARKSAIESRIYSMNWLMKKPAGQKSWHCPFNSITSKIIYTPIDHFISFFKFHLF
jgi:hypothetical protein